MDFEKAGRSDIIFQRGAFHEEEQGKALAGAAAGSVYGLYCDGHAGTGTGGRRAGRAGNGR